MTPAQVEAFEDGTGSFFTAAELLVTVQLIGATILITYVAWLCYTAYNDYCEDEIKPMDMIVIWFRAVGVMMVVLYLLIN